MPAPPKRERFHGPWRIEHKFVFSSDCSFYTFLSHVFQKLGRVSEGACAPDFDSGLKNERGLKARFAPTAATAKATAKVDTKTEATAKARAKDLTSEEVSYMN
jgi:hypothetical protein